MYECGLCRKDFKDVSNCKRHIFSIHMSWLCRRKCDSEQLQLGGIAATADNKGGLHPPPSFPVSLNKSSKSEPRISTSTLETAVAGTSGGLSKRGRPPRDSPTTTRNLKHCKECRRDFGRSQYYNHMARVHNALFPCNACSRKFYSEENRLAHFNSCHAVRKINNT